MKKETKYIIVAIVVLLYIYWLSKSSVKLPNVSMLEENPILEIDDNKQEQQEQKIDIVEINNSIDYAGVETISNKEILKSFRNPISSPFGTFYL